RAHEAADTRGERRASHLGGRAVVVPGQDDHAVALAVVVERVRVAVAGRAGQPGLDELSDGERGRDEEEDCFHDGLPSWLVVVDQLAAGIRGAVAKFTLKRLHQMVTARYRSRSIEAGSS